MRRSLYPGRDPEIMKKDTVVNILFCGTGGQGVLAASEICGWAALVEGYHVKKSEVHGMAQRGGSVESHVRFGKKVFSPLIAKGSVDYLVSFHKEEHIRMVGFLKPKGIDLIASFDASHTYLADKRFLNIFLLGALSRYLPLKIESWFAAINTVFADKNPEENKKMFLKGRESG